MKVADDPYLQKAVDFAEMAESARDAQSRINYTILADCCYRRLSRRVAPVPSARDAEIKAMAQRIVDK
jgi:hypothetical protein